MTPETDPRWKHAQETLGMTPESIRTEAERIERIPQSHILSPDGWKCSCGNARAVVTEGTLPCAFEISEIHNATVAALLRVQQAQRERLITVVRDILVEELPGADSVLERLLDAIRQEGEGTHDP